MGDKTNSDENVHIGNEGRVLTLKAGYLPTAGGQSAYMLPMLQQNAKYKFEFLASGSIKGFDIRFDDKSTPLEYDKSGLTNDKIVVEVVNAERSCSVQIYHRHLRSY